MAFIFYFQTFGSDDSLTEVNEEGLGNVSKISKQVVRQTRHSRNLKNIVKSMNTDSDNSMTEADGETDDRSLGNINKSPRLIGNPESSNPVHRQSENTGISRTTTENSDTDEADSCISHLTCSICQKSFSYRYGLKVHVTKMHGEDKLCKCDKCFRSYATRRELDAHLILHFEQDGREFRKNAPKIKKESGPFSCTECDKVFATKQYLQIHLKAHADGRNPCRVCQKTFATAESLKSHMKIHADVKPYKCPTCGKAFRDKRSLEPHKASHIQNPDRIWWQMGPRKCEYCPKEFLSKHQYLRHLLIHTKEKKYQCSYCGKPFGLNTSLHNHEKIHTGERPHKCSYCGKGFIRGPDMKRHELTHKNKDYSPR
jgi:DNA-directed RNA polymerase subunit RPC12/RpoP